MQDWLCTEISFYFGLQVESSRACNYFLLFILGDWAFGLISPMCHRLSLPPTGVRVSVLVRVSVWVRVLGGFMGGASL